MDYQNIPYKNDRTRLVLYKYMDSPNVREYKKLSRLYSDNAKYENVIIDELFGSQYVCIVGGERYCEKDGQIRTTDLGRKALLTGRFPSEVKTARNSRIIKILTLIFSAVASIGGLKYIIEYLKTI